IMTAANCSLADNALINNTASISAVTVDPDTTNNSASSTTTAKNPPPMITCPADRNVATGLPGAMSVTVTYPSPGVTANCLGATFVCSPPSGASFSLGTTMVICTATDSGGRTASCSFKVTVFDVCIQDDKNSDFLLFNSFTGEYLFTKCGVDGFTKTG